MSWIAGMLGRPKETVAPKKDLGHDGLFDGLCRLHAVDEAARALMLRIAAARKLAHPGRLFLEPHWLDPATLQGLPEDQASSLATLRNRLFGIGGPAGSAGGAAGAGAISVMDRYRQKYLQGDA